MDDFKVIKPLKKRKRERENNIKSPVKRLVSNVESTRPSNEWCPICQLNFRSKNRVENFHHMENCCGAQESANECPNGRNCHELIISHFREFTHFELALERSCSITDMIKLEQTQRNLALKGDKDVNFEKPVNYEDIKKEPPSQNTKNEGNTEDLNIQESFPCSSYINDLNRHFCDISGEITVCDEVVQSKSISVKQKLSSSSCDCEMDFAKFNLDRLCNINVNFSSVETSENYTSQWINKPILLDLTINSRGWRKINVSCPSDFEISDLELILGNCCHKLEMKCSIGRKIISKIGDTCGRTQEWFDFASLGLNCENLSESCMTGKLFLDSVDHNVCSEDNNFRDDVNHEMFGETYDLNSPEDLVQNQFEEKIVHNQSDRVEENDSDNDLCSFKEETKNSTNDCKKVWKSIFEKKNSTSLETTPPLPHNYDSSRKQCPFHKRIPGTSFAVDAFQYGAIPGVTHYFLTHFHADHYGGLTKKFKQKIFCSGITASLVAKILYVEPKYLRVVKCNLSFTVDDVKTTPLDANHCPGSLMFLFQLKSGKSYLHVGDFRASSEMKLNPVFSTINVDTLFLDTTYCNPQYQFPSQHEVVQAAIKITQKYLDIEPKTLIVSGTYTIGKEKVFVGIAEALGSNIWAPKTKLNVLKCLEDKFINSKLVEYPCKARVHVWPMTKLNHFHLEQHLMDCSQVFKRILAFSPSGWNFKKECALEDARAITRGRVTIIGLPYSEHSSYMELQDFVKFLKPVRVVPTVAPKNLSFSATSKCCNKWLTEGEAKIVALNQKKITTFLTSP